MNKLAKIRKAMQTIPDSDLPYHEARLAAIAKILGKEPKLFAIVHDGTFDGDSGFWVDSDRIKYKEGQGIRDVRAAYHAHRIKLDVESQKDLSPEVMRDACDEINETYTSQIKGAWIVDEDGLKVINAVLDAHGPPGGDHAAYRMNRSAKALANALAIKRLGKKAK